jgi:hypothetical protein
MFIKRIFIVIAIVLFASCSQRSQLILVEKQGTLGGKLIAHINVQPALARYLYDLDLFMGKETDTTMLPSSIANIFTQTKQQYPQFTSAFSYTEKDGLIIDFSFEFDDYQALFQSTDLSFIPRIITISSGKVTTLSLIFDHSTHQSIEKINPLVLPMPPEVNAKTRSQYIQNLAKTMAHQPDEIAHVQQDIMQSQFTVAIKTPRPIKTIQGGVIDSHDPSTAIFAAPVLSLLFLEKKQVYTLSY